jgi:hypothetical protein
MKKFAYLLIFILFCNITFSGQKSWYQIFTGNIGNYPVTMHLTCYDNNVRGFYYYNKYKKPMEVFGTVTGDSLTLSSYYSYDWSEIFKGIFKSNEYKGSWVDTKDETKSLDFRLSTTASSGYEFVYVQGSERLFKDLETPQANYMQGAVWPDNTLDNAQFIRNQVLKLLDMKSGLTEIGGLMLENKKKFMADFKKDNSELKRDDVADGGWSYSLDWNEVVMPVYNDNKIMVLSSYIYTYTGGAHGNYGTGFYNYDLVHRKQLSLSDLVSTAGIKALPKLLEKNYKLANGIPKEKSLTDAGLFVDTIPVNDNFIFTPGTLMFDYVPYEIASYADGEVKIYIPIEQIKEYLKPQALELLKQ